MLLGGKELKKEIINEHKNKLKNICDKNTLPIILFFVVFINFFTLIRLNYNTKASYAAGAKELAIAFGIGLIILFAFYIKKVKISKTMLVEFGALIAITLVWSIVQLINYKSGNYYLLDILNIPCKFVNVLFLFIFLINMELDEKYIFNFMRLLILMGIVACIFNFIIFYKDILATLKIISIDGKIISAKSFFAQKNQFAYFLFTCIVSCFIMIVRSDKMKNKILYAVLVFLFLFNMVFTTSRTGLVITIAFMGLFLLFNNKMKINTKIITVLLILIFSGVGIYLLYQHNPELIEDRLLRRKSISTLTGRTKIWDVALGIAKENNLTIFFGAGRFKGVEAINNEKLPFTQFHNTYIEFLVSGGILELLYFLSIYVFVIINVLKSKTLDKKYKILYLCMFAVYFVYMFSESLGRFSIGGSDVLGLIFFVTIPLLHSNIIPENVKTEGEGK